MTSAASGIRDHEISVDLPEPSDAQLRFIGRIHTPWAKRADCPRQGSLDGPICTVELFEPWGPGLKGLEAHKTVELFYWLDQARRDLVVQNPGSKGDPRGTFALRSPVRPNPIGVSMVRLDSIDGLTLKVRGLDCLDGTPLVDIKPERCAHSPR